VSFAFRNAVGDSLIMGFNTISGHTVDGRNSAPADMVNIPLFLGLYTSQLVQDFFHQQYVWDHICFENFFQPSLA